MAKLAGNIIAFPKNGLDDAVPRLDERTRQSSSISFLEMIESLERDLSELKHHVESVIDVLPESKQLIISNSFNVEMSRANRLISLLREYSNSGIQQSFS